MDTFMHAWGSIAALLETSITEGIICDIGMPVIHRNVSYNCRVILLNRRVIGIRPKIYLANDGNYREMRWFTPWFIDPTTPGFGPLQDFTLPPNIMALNGQKTCPIGIFAISTLDTTLAFETCEELFTPNSPHIRQVSYPIFPPYVTTPPIDHRHLSRAAASLSTGSSSSQMARGRTTSCESWTSASSSSRVPPQRRAASTSTRTRQVSHKSHTHSSRL